MIAYPLNVFCEEGIAKSENIYEANDNGEERKVDHTRLSDYPPFIHLDI